MELKTAKEILAEVFHARPSEMEEMIQMLKKRSAREGGGWRRSAWVIS
jgi:hypothetical protein